MGRGIELLVNHRREIKWLQNLTLPEIRNTRMKTIFFTLLRLHTLQTVKKNLKREVRSYQMWTRGVTRTSVLARRQIYEVIIVGAQNLTPRYRSPWYVDYFQETEGSGRTFDLPSICLKNFRQRTCSRKEAITIDNYSVNMNQAW